MRNSAKITLCALSAALAAAFMLGSYFPYLTYTIPAIAGLFVMVPLAEINYKYSCATYIVSSVLIFLLAEKEAAILYLFFFGHYPILKGLIEKIKKTVIEWILKISVFNICVVAAYFVLSVVFDIRIEDLGEFGKYSAYILLAAANVVFVFYDIAVSRAAAVYVYKIHPQIRKIIK